MEHHFKNRNAILWDFDGVLYSYHFNDIEPQELHSNFFSANGKGARELIPSLSDEDAYRLGGETFLKYHDTVTGFLQFREETGLSVEEFKSRLLKAQLKWSYKHISENIPELIAPCDETNQLFAALDKYVNHAMITHANAEYWAKPVSNNLGVADYFDYILGYDDFDFQSKGKSAHAVTIALEKLNANAAQAVFVEDQVLHLEVAKNAYPDLCTVLIEGEEPIDQPEYVDVMVSRPKDFMRVLLETKHSEKVAA